MLRKNNIDTVVRYKRELAANYLKSKKLLGKLLKNQKTISEMFVF